MTAAIPVTILLFVMAAHWVADFVLQFDRMAKNKSSSLLALTAHVAVYTIVLVLVAPFAMSGCSSLQWTEWVLLNAVLHWVIDYFTSRASAPLFKAGDVHFGFVVVGADQFMHLACLVLTMVYFRG
jgi:hypothetical protein